jgi:hypothetical protein
VFFSGRTNFIGFSTKAIAKILENYFFSIVNLINLTNFLETQKKKLKIAKFPKSQILEF